MHMDIREWESVISRVLLAAPWSLSRLHVHRLRVALDAEADVERELVALLDILRKRIPVDPDVALVEVLGLAARDEAVAVLLAPRLEAALELLVRGRGVPRRPPGGGLLGLAFALGLPLRTLSGCLGRRRRCRRRRGSVEQVAHGGGLVGRRHRVGVRRHAHHVGIVHAGHAVRIRGRGHAIPILGHAIRVRVHLLHAIVGAAFASTLARALALAVLALALLALAGLAFPLALGIVGLPLAFAVLALALVLLALHKNDVEFFVVNRLPVHLGDSLGGRLLGREDDVSEAPALPVVIFLHICLEDLSELGEQSFQLLAARALGEVLHVYPCTALAWLLHLHAEPPPHRRPRFKRRDPEVARRLRLGRHD
mmetsp:Transcript_76148/g.199722  ORF Transcript_76148/g.199722 Transcript_76148/m.199722 type:complete len:368 (-) Transcript_76148:80-1183(-)